MCARRFLLLIFWLIILAVAAGFAIYQYGGRVLTSATTPTGHFAAPAVSTGPDYKLDSSWLAKPGLKDDPSRWRPTGETPVEPEPFLRIEVATFYLHPTTYLARDKWNAEIDEPGDPFLRDRLFVQSQAGVFNHVSTIWAPRYRQAAFGAFLLHNDDANKALDLGYRDVLAAFDVFLAAQPHKTPIILAGHSQGALHLSRLLVDRRDALKGRLVAAYVVGWPLSAKADLPAMGLPPCTTPDETGCILSWMSFGEPANASMILDNWVGTKGANGSVRARGDVVCVNPLTGTHNGAAIADRNGGTLVPTADFSTATLIPKAVGARCEQGLLEISGAIPPLGPYVLPGNNYHVYDYALFWSAIRNDADTRTRAWH
ncbi:DUF3089 domain-containing protein [Sphingomonas sp.]|uniref:DUF3089 domain-containing protein n=1 Tax=Sphingomonas sp. TaxID=28214 RepID=UPI00286A9B89|nr:DUF3089 domain-containing protein [Sphingomonas sp.]